MLGSYAVGKTSLVENFVRSVFSEKYLTTVGVKVDKKQVDVDGTPVDLLIWDIQGEDSTRAVPSSYLRGCSGYLLVVDGTRRETLTAACRLQERAEHQKSGLPFVALLNKVDIEDRWEIDNETAEGLTAKGWQVVKASAKTGEGVQDAFRSLAGRIVEREL